MWSPSWRLGGRGPARWQRWRATSAEVRASAGLRGVAVTAAARVPDRLLHVEWFAVLEQTTAAPEPMGDGEMRWAGPREEDLFASLGEDPEVIRRRRGRGDMAAVVVRGGRLVAHVWCRRGSYDEQGMIVQLGEREAWLYDGFVAPERRGEGIYPALVRAVSAALAAAGVDRLLSGIDHLNQPSLRSARSRGAVAIGSITMVRVLGLSVRREDWFGSVRYHVHRGTAPLVIPPRADSRRRPVPMRGRSD